MARFSWHLFMVALAGIGATGPALAQEPVGTRPPAAPSPATAEERVVLLSGEKFELEPSIEFTHYSVNRLVLEGYTVIPAITVGSIDVRKVDRDTLTFALTGRYTFTDRFQMDLRVPYVSRWDSTTAREVDAGADGDSVTDINGNGLGDVELGLHYQLPTGGHTGPFYTLNLRAKSRTGEDPFEVPVDPVSGLERELPTGTGFWGVEPSVTVLLPSDPVVFYGNLGYLWNIERDVVIQGDTGETEIDPGDAVRLNLGMGFGLNERASFSLGYEHSYVFETKQDGTDIKGTDLQVGSLLLGWSYRKRDNETVSLTISTGVTEDAPDVQIALRLPGLF